MKKLFFSLLVLLGLCLQAPAQFLSAEVEVSGLTCSMCSRATEKSLRTLPFVADVQPDLEHAYFIVSFKPGSAVSMDALRQKVLDAGFTVSRLEAVVVFNGSPVQPDAHLLYADAAYHFINTPTRTLTGPVRLRFMDKGFIPEKQFKQQATQVKHPCYLTGTRGACCPLPGTAPPRIYHVSLVG